MLAQSELNCILSHRAQPDSILSPGQIALRQKKHGVGPELFQLDSQLCPGLLLALALPVKGHALRYVESARAVRGLEHETASQDGLFT